MDGDNQADVLVIGSGMGGATFAAGLAPSARESSFWNAASVWSTARMRATRARSSNAASSGRRRNGSTAAGQPFNPGNYYYVGGNSKFYGAVLIRYRAEDFSTIVHRDGTTPGWPFAYDELEPWYTRAERLYQVRGALGFDPTEPRAFRALSASRRSRRARHRGRARAAEEGRAAPVLAAARRRHRALAERAADAVGRLSRTRDPARWMRRAAASPRRWRIQTSTLRTGVRGRAAARWRRTASGSRASRRSARASAQRSRPGSSCCRRARSIRRRCCCAAEGVANRSDTVGRHFMNHNSSAVLAVDPRTVNDFGLSEDARDQRFLSRRRQRRSAARQHPAARPGHRRRSSRPICRGRRNGRCIG